MKKKHHPAERLNIKNLVKCIMLITQKFNELKKNFEKLNLPLWIRSNRKYGYS